ncbi:rubredoxin [Pseudomonas sp. NY11955]|uniref:rubredoxin n=1 Tax=Pseudomonas sp. NY11955 TaxID=3400363 RepID=UPI003A84E55C
MSVIYECTKCWYVYDEHEGCEDLGIHRNTKFSDLPESFRCPLCGVEKISFELCEVVQ